MGRRMVSPALDTNLMAWEPLAVKGSEGKAWIKTLAKDDETGARTALIKFDPGYRQARAVSVWPMDMFVLEGDMRCGEQHYQKGTFHYRPAGVEYGPIDSPRGITRLVFTGDSKTRASRQEVFIPNVDDTPWGPSYSDPTAKRSGLKVLRQDQVAKASILMAISFKAAESPSSSIVHGAIHQHDHVEESFILAGEFHDYHDGIEGHVRQSEGYYGCREPNMNAHGDPTAFRYPIIQFIRRGWTGDWMRYYETYHSVPVPPVVFVE